MSFALLYRSLSHTRWYWSVSQNFTQKSERQFTWGSAADLAADYPKLRSHYPTLFAKKRAEAFWIYDLAHDDATQLSLAAADSADVPADDAPKQKPKMIKQSPLIHRQLLIQWLCKQARPNSRGMIPKHQNILH